METPPVEPPFVEPTSTESPSAEPPSVGLSPSGPPIRRVILWGFLLAVLLAVAVAAFMAPKWLQQSVPAAELPVYAEVPDFQLLNRDGRSVSREDLLGRPWIADFVFTRCQVSCPAMTQRMAALRPGLPDDFPLVSVSVDPEHDRPEVLEAYARRYEAGERWLFLTGEKDEVYELVQGGFKLGVQPVAPEEMERSREPITHSTRFVLVDAEGRIRGYYDAFDAAALTRLLQDLSRLR